MNYYRYESYQKNKGEWKWINIPEKGNALSYGDLKEESYPESYKKNELYIMPDELSGSDYSNSSTVEISNHRVFLESFKEINGVHDVFGGFGTYAVAIRLDVYESNQEIKETIDNLKDYCIINEDDLSELEREKTDEAWDSWARESMLSLIQESDPRLEEFNDHDDFDIMFFQAAEEAHEYWEAEAGGSMSIRLENITPYLRDMILVALTEKEDLPLLVSHEWVSKKAQKDFETKLKG